MREEKLHAFLKRLGLIGQVAAESGYNRVLVSKVLKGFDAKATTMKRIWEAAIKIAEAQEGYIVVVKKEKLYKDIA